MSDQGPVDNHNQLVLAEMRRLQTERFRPATFVLMLVVVSTLVCGALPLRSLFWNWRWTVLGLILPLTILNELGHVIALLCFGGRNLGECIFPFVGVTEMRDWGGLTRWKRAVVALAGPVLSIAVVIALAAIYRVHAVAWVFTAMIELSVLAAISLSPVWPYDGGYVVDLLLACRRGGLRIAFRLLSVLGNLPALGIWMLIKLPDFLRTERITKQLRLQGLEINAETGAIDAGDAAIIVRELRRQMPAATTVECFSQHAFAIHERVATRPPTGRVTLVLAMLYVGCIVAVRLVPIAGLMSAWGVQAKKAEVARDKAKDAHRGELHCGDYEHHVAHPDSDSVCQFVVASFDTETGARTWMTNRTWHPPQDFDRLRLGRSLVLVVPKEKSGLVVGLLNSVKSSASHAFSTTHVMGRIVAVAPDQATADQVANVLNHYLNRGGAELIEPWSPLAEVSAEAAKWRALRAQYVKEVEGTLDQDPRVQKAHANLNQAVSLNPKTSSIHDPKFREYEKEVDRYRKELAARKLAVQRERHDTMFQKAESDSEREFLNLCQKRFVDPHPLAGRELDLRRVANLKLDQLQGRLPSTGKHHSIQDRRYSESGRVEQEGLDLHILLHSSPRMDYAWPQIVRYLCDRGLKPVRYEFVPR